MSGLDSSVLIALAQIGYFVDTDSAKNARETRDIKCSLSSLTKQIYKIRQVDKRNDLCKLDDLESLAWKDNRISREVIERRLSNYEHGTWVAEIESQIIGVMHTQRIKKEALEEIKKCSINFAQQETLHCNDGDILQLLGVAVLHQYANLQIGATLRNFVVSGAEVDNYP